MNQVLSKPVYQRESYVTPLPPRYRLETKPVGQDEHEVDSEPGPSTNLVRIAFVVLVCAIIILLAELVY